MKLSDLIRKERENRGWSQRDLASMLKVSHGAVAQWEQENTKPKLKYSLEMFRLFEISLDELTNPGSPYFGQLVDDPEELAVLTAWRGMKANDRVVVLRMLNAFGVGVAAPVDPAPDRPRKKRDV